MPKPLPENRDAWEVFRACSTQWSYAAEMAAGMGTPVVVSRPTGLPADRVEAKARGRGVKADTDFWHRLELLEMEALRAMREQQ